MTATLKLNKTKQNKTKTKQPTNQQTKTLAPLKKSCDKPTQHIKKQKHYFADKGPSQLYSFPVVTYSCVSRILNKTEHRKFFTSELWCWRALLRVPWIPRRSNHSILKEISPEYSLKRLMLKLKL